MIRLQPHLRPRLLVSALATAAVFLALPGNWTANTRLLAAWDVGVLLYLAATSWAMMRASRASIMARAREEDNGAVAVLTLTLVAAVASLAAIALELHGIRNAQPTQSSIRLILAGVTILCSWFFVHTIYAVHYAHEFYGDDGERQGLKFPGEEEPEYGEFLYFSFNMGAAAQTSDVTVLSRRMRRLVLSHTILAFLFNTTILALAINVAAGLL